MPARHRQPVKMARRALLLAAPALILTACAKGGLTATPNAGRSAALLLPLTGAAAAIGQAMAQAAGLVAGGAPPAFDTADTAEGAAKAARQALDGGAKILFGPLRADQTPAVLSVAGNVPVISFSNDDGLASQGAYVMGLTPAQSVATMFSYARAQGIRRIAVLGRDGPLAAAALRAAGPLAKAGGLDLVAGLLRDPQAGGTMAALRQAAGGALPDAVFLPDGGATLAAYARDLAGNGVQMLGSTQWGINDISADPALEGAWFAGPPPDLFMPFSDRFQAAHGSPPGLVAALGHDAALVAEGLANAKGLNRKGLQREAGFTGVLGPFRFQEDGRCLRALSVLAVARGSLSVLAEVSDA